MLARASVLLILGFAALPGCTHDREEDAAITAPGAVVAAIPSGAVGAVGVSFDLPVTAEHDDMPLLSHPKPKRSLPVPAPLDPFADPPSASGHDGEPPPTPPMHRRRGTSL